MSNYFFTSESVTEGHPDKLCDQISDALLDAILILHPTAHTCIETVVTTNYIMVMGEVTPKPLINYEAIVREVVRKCGYTSPHLGFSADDCRVFINLDTQSTEIENGVNHSQESQINASEFDTLGAGDQGMVFGYACDETPQLLPAPIYWAHQLTYALAQARKGKLSDLIYSDGKAQVTVEYENNQPKRIDTILISVHEKEAAQHHKLYNRIVEEVIKSTVPASLIGDTKFIVNPAGVWTVGGPKADSGLTGRKIIVDTYGGMCAHGGGSFSGKDPTKVDRSAAYMARYVCKHIVAAKLAKKCELQVSYAIGIATPVSMYLNTYDTGVVDDQILLSAIKRIFDFRPAAIIHNLNLQRPIYSPTACYGHFRSDHYPWEMIDSTIIGRLQQTIN